MNATNWSVASGGGLVSCKRVSKHTTTLSLATQQNRFFPRRVTSYERETEIEHRQYLNNKMETKG